MNQGRATTSSGIGSSDLRGEPRLASGHLFDPGQRRGIVEERDDPSGLEAVAL